MYSTRNPSRRTHMAIMQSAHTFHGTVENVARDRQKTMGIDFSVMWGISAAIHLHQGCNDARPLHDAHNDTMTIFFRCFA